MSTSWRAITVILISACTSSLEDEPVPSARHDELVFGTDDRREPYEATAVWQHIGETSVAAMMNGAYFNTRWHFCDGRVRTVGDSIGTTNNLCSEVKYRNQRAVSRCSSTLIDVDVVATAGHCLEDFGCDGTVFIFGVYNLPVDGGVPKDVKANDIYGCRRVLITGSAQGIDMAVVQLDRPVMAPFAPAAIAKESPAVGDPVSLIGFPTGIPMKVTNNCNVMVIGNENYATNCDGFAGNSGSGTFIADGGFFGVEVTGLVDYVPDPRGCKVVNVYDDAGYKASLPGAQPQRVGVTSVLNSLNVFCDGGYPSALCGRTAVCGDGVCSGGETHGSCAGDCAELTCGDHTCSFSEFETCPTDCGARDDSLLCNGTRAVDAGVADAGLAAITDAGARGIDAGTSAADAGLTAPGAPSSCGCSSGESMLGLLGAIAAALAARKRQC